MQIIMECLHTSIIKDGVHQTFISSWNKELVMLCYGCIPELSFLGCLTCYDTRGGVVVLVGVLLIIITPQQELV
jgi:hypothetical protein